MGGPSALGDSDTDTSPADSEAPLGSLGGFEKNPWEAAGLRVEIDYRTLERLQEREHQLAAAQRVAELGSWEWDLASGEVTWSDQLYRLVGRAPGEGLVDCDALLALVSEEQREAANAAVRKALASGTPFAADWEVRTEDGTLRILESRGQVVLDPSGQVLRLVGRVGGLHVDGAGRAVLHRCHPRRYGA